MTFITQSASGIAKSDSKITVTCPKNMVYRPPGPTIVINSTMFTIILPSISFTLKTTANVINSPTVYKSYSGLAFRRPYSYSRIYEKLSAHLTVVSSTVKTQSKTY